MKSIYCLAAASIVGAAAALTLLLSSTPAQAQGTQRSKDVQLGIRFQLDGKTVESLYDIEAPSRDFDPSWVGVPAGTKLTLFWRHSGAPRGQSYRVRVAYKFGEKETPAQALAKGKFVMNKEVRGNEVRLELPAGSDKPGFLLAWDVEYPSGKPLDRSLANGIAFIDAKEAKGFAPGHDTMKSARENAAQGPIHIPWRSVYWHSWIRTNRPCPQPR